MGQSVPPLGGARGLDDGLANIRLARHLADAGQPRIGMDLHNQNVLGSIGDLGHLGETEVDRFHVGDLHGGTKASGVRQRPAQMYCTAVPDAKPSCRAKAPDDPRAPVVFDGRAGAA